MNRHAVTTTLLCLPLATATWITSTLAQGWPAKPVRIVIPFAPGASADILTRHFGPKYAETFGQQFILDNRGAAGSAGVQAAAAAAPDGYTFMTATAAHAMDQSLRKKAAFDLARDFDPVALFASAPFMLLVHPSLPVKSVKELIALAKARPGQLTFGSAVAGSTSHLIGELFKTQTNVNLVHVAYKGTAYAVTDLIGGRISMMFSNNLGSHVKSGRLRALAMTSAKRSTAAPELPTLAEAGVPGFESTTWFALVAPAGTPRDAVTRLNEATGKLLKTPEIRELLLTQNSAEPIGGSPEQAAAHIRSEIAKWGQVIRAAGISLD